MITNKTLAKAVNALPLLPGCYIFRDASGEVLYVGKSKQVKNRVRQYFQHTEDRKIRKLVRMIDTVEYKPAETEIEALLLEYRLIKRYRPPFNVLMKKDRQPPYIKMDTSRERPGLSVVFGPVTGAPCFGHFANTWAANDALTLLNEVWPIPLCGKPYFDGTNERPCLRFHMGRCMGPCATSVDLAAYNEMLASLCAFLNGRNRRVLSQIKKEMRIKSKEWDFEQAARLRDRHRALTQLARRLDTTGIIYASKRLCLFIKGYHEEAFLLLYIADGRVRMKERFMSENEWPGASAKWAERIVHKAWDMEPDAFLTKAASTVQARRHYMDLTRVKKEEIIRQKLEEAFEVFYHKNKE